MSELVGLAAQKIVEPWLGDAKATRGPGLRDLPTGDFALNGDHELDRIVMLAVSSGVSLNASQTFANSCCSIVQPFRMFEQICFKRSRPNLAPLSQRGTVIP